MGSQMTEDRLRYNHAQIREDLKEKMVFLSGPRQVGKTTLAKKIVPLSAYLNWDIPEHREQILKGIYPSEEPIWALDEIHKFSKWRNTLKGLYDKFHGTTEILITGSARLDFYRRGGDSLQGRYLSHRLHPLSWREIQGQTPSDWKHLFTMGGFPEPFFKGSETYQRRWRRNYRTRLIQEEVNSLERVNDLSKLEQLALFLPQRVGSPLSIASLSRDLETSPKTTTHWIQILERLFSLFLVSSYHTKSLRSVKKEKKHYHWDWTQVESPPARLENLVASHLWKYVHFLQDAEGLDTQLYYYKDTEGREVDFVVADPQKPMLMIEVKWSDEEISKPLKYLHTKFPEAEAWQVHATGTKDYVSAEGIRVSPVIKLLDRLL